MSNLSEGQLHCTPVRIVTEKTLVDIKNFLQTVPYTGRIPTQGWGSVLDDTSAVRALNAARPEPGVPSVSLAEGLLPVRMKARYYWDQVDLRAVRLLGDSAPVEQTHSLNAVDLVLGHFEGDPHIQGVVTTRSVPELRGYVMRGVRDALTGADPRADVQFDVIDMAIPSDFYLWLLHRYDSDQSLSDDLTLEVIRTLSSEDVLARGTSLTQGAQMDRTELASMVLNAPNKFGPARFSLLDTGMKLSVEIELYPDGSFQVILGGSDYDERLDRSIKGSRIVDDLVFTVLPKLRRAYSFDVGWPNPGRDSLTRRGCDVLVAQLREVFPDAVIQIPDA